METKPQGPQMGTGTQFIDDYDWNTDHNPRPEVRVTPRSFLQDIGHVATFLFERSGLREKLTRLHRISLGHIALHHADANEQSTLDIVSHATTTPEAGDQHRPTALRRGLGRIGHYLASYHTNPRHALQPLWGRSSYVGSWLHRPQHSTRALGDMRATPAADIISPAPARRDVRPDLDGPTVEIAMPALA